MPGEERPAPALWARFAQVLHDGATGLDGQWQYVRTSTFGTDNLQGAVAPVKMLQLQTIDLANS
jgi:hypothetical protein